MPQDMEASVNYDEELAQIDEIISNYRLELKQLIAQRQVLLTKKQHVDMDIVLEHIIELGLSSNEVLELISKAKKNGQH